MLRILVSFFIFNILFLPQYLLGDELDTLITKGGYLFPQGDSKSYKTKNLDTLFVPASTTKILTSLLAMERLGGNYRFSTTFYYRDDTLVIRGGGDPYLVTQEVKAICLALKEQGIERVKKLIIDNSLYALPHPASGTEDSLNPYDSHVSALAVNFNSIAIRVNSKGEVRSDEKWMPYLSLFKDLPHLNAGGHRINVNALGKNGLTGPERYAGELFLALMQEVGIDTDCATITSLKQPHQMPLILEWKSRENLEAHLVKCLKYSNNFIANQVFLQLAIGSAPLSWEKSAQIMADYLKEIGLSTQSVRIIEGSGLSRKNYISPRAMHKVLLAFRPYHRLLSHTEETATFIKTGTLTGVYTLAGYVEGQEELLPFSIFLEQKNNTRYQILDKLLNKYQEDKDKL